MNNNILLHWRRKVLSMHKWNTTIQTKKYTSDKLGTPAEKRENFDETIDVWSRDGNICDAEKSSREMEGSKGHELIRGWVDLHALELQQRDLLRLLPSDFHPTYHLNTLSSLQTEELLYPLVVDPISPHRILEKTTRVSGC